MPICSLFNNERVKELVTVKDIYDHIDSFAPYSTQEAYDNSGLNVGNFEKEVSTVMLALDITCDVAMEAVFSGADLVISHHPVIFKGLKCLDMNDPAVMLACGDVAALSMHTNYDSAKGGMNDILCKKLGLVPKESLAAENGVGIGYICDVDEENVFADHFAKKCKGALGCKAVRYFNSGEQIKRVAVCSGSGGSFVPVAIAKGCQLMITGDVKHDVFIDAYNKGFSLIDAGHFYTEDIFFEDLKSRLLEKFPNLIIGKASSDKDFFSYEF